MIRGGFLKPINLTDQFQKVSVEYKCNYYFKLNTVNTPENEAHGDMEQNCFLFFFQNTYKKIPILFPRCTPEK